MTEERIDVADGKYTVILRDDGTSAALRYGKPWPAYDGQLLDNLTVALARDLRGARATQPVASAAPADNAELVERLLAWLRSRAEPDSGITYGTNRQGCTRVELSGSDATFVADNFHGTGARKLADAIAALAHPLHQPAPEAGKLANEAEAALHKFWGSWKNGDERAHGWAVAYGPSLIAALRRASPAPEVEEERPAVYIQAAVLRELEKDKTASGTVCSGLLKHPFGDPIALYTHPAPAPEPQAPVPDGVMGAMVEAEWDRLCEKDDRTSPAAYPDMALITREELADAMRAAFTAAERRR